MFDVYSCLKPSRTMFYSVLLLVSPNSCYVANSWLPTRGKGAYTRTGMSTRTLQNNRLNCRIQPLHVGMQKPGHFSAVVFRNRTWKPHFLSFVENVNDLVVVFTQYISAVVVRKPVGIALPWRAQSLVLEENQWKLLSCFELAMGG